MMKIDTNTAANKAGQDDAVKAAKASQAAEKFEAFFVAQMLRQMRAGTRALADEDSPLKNRVNEDMQDFADGLMADGLARQRAFGIADVILKQLLPQVAAPGKDSKDGAI